MTAYTAQEELDQLKSWWKIYGNSLIVGVVLGVVMLVGFRYWTQQREIKRVTASAIYEQLLEQLRANKPEARASGEKIINEYASTPYAPLAALLLSKQAYLSGDKALARKQLEWALAHADDAAVQHTARLRLGRLILESNETQGLAALLDVKDVAGFETEYQELKGDVAVAQGKKDEARVAYEEALKKSPPGSSYAMVLKMKHDDLGAEKK